MPRRRSQSWWMPTNDLWAHDGARLRPKHSSRAANRSTLYSVAAASVVRRCYCFRPWLLVMCVDIVCIDAHLHFCLHLGQIIQELLTWQYTRWEWDFFWCPCAVRCIHCIQLAAPHDLPLMGNLAVSGARLHTAWVFAGANWPNSSFQQRSGHQKTHTIKTRWLIADRYFVVVVVSVEEIWDGWMWKLCHLSRRSREIQMISTQLIWYL